MELIENVVLILGGFIGTLITMEASWRLASKQIKKPTSSAIMTRQEIRA